MEPALRKRVVTALTLAAVYCSILALAVFFKTALVVFVALGALAVIIGIFEFRSFHDEQSPAREWYLIIGVLPFLPFITAGLFCSKIPDPDSLFVFFAWICGVLLQLLVINGWLLLGIREHLHDCFNIAREAYLFSLMLGAGASALVLLPLLPGGVAALFWMSLVISAVDIAAYFVGKKYGNRKLSPVISPGKTGAGTAGGILAGLIVGVPLMLIYDSETDVIAAILVTFVLIIAAQLGDLAESYLKRIHNKKDSGTILPGHGGVLDRLDSYFGAAPVLFIALSAYLALS